MYAFGLLALNAALLFRAREAILKQKEEKLMKAKAAKKARRWMLCLLL